MTLVSMTSPGALPVTLNLPDGTTVTTNVVGVVSVPSQFVTFLIEAGWSFSSAAGT